MTDKDLHAATDALNVKLAAAEKLLQDMNLGVKGFVHLHLSGDSVLEFRKVGDTWGLFVSLQETQTGTRGAPRHILSVSREHRINAAHLLGRLLENIQLRYEAERGLVDAANVAADSFLSHAASIARDKPA